MNAHSQVKNFDTVHFSSLCFNCTFQMYFNVLLKKQNVVTTLRLHSVPRC